MLEFVNTCWHKKTYFHKKCKLNIELIANPKIIEPIQNDATSTATAFFPIVGISAGIADRQMPVPAMVKAMACPRLLFHCEGVLATKQPQPNETGKGRQFTASPVQSG